LAISEEGKAYAIGANHRGQLGLGDKVEREAPCPLASLKRKKVSQLALGQSFAVMLGSDVSHAELLKKKERRKLARKQKDHKDHKRHESAEDQANQQR
jgi:hypothetical protein